MQIHTEEIQNKFAMFLMREAQCGYQGRTYRSAAPQACLRDKLGHESGRIVKVRRLHDDRESCHNGESPARWREHRHLDFG